MRVADDLRRGSRGRGCRGHGRGEGKPGGGEHAFVHACARFEYGCIIGRFAAGRQIDQRLNMVTAFEQRRGQVAIDGSVLRTGAIQYAFDHMREGDDGIETEQTRRPFDRMRGAK